MARKDKKLDSEYKNNYAKENYYRPSILLPKGMKPMLEQYLQGESMNNYINRLILEDLEK